jgi:hypothetical protein
MNENMHSDDEILAGVRRRLSGAEALVPQPPNSAPAFDEPSRVRPRVVVRSRAGVGGFAALAVVAALVVVAVGFGFGTRAPSGNGAAGAPGPAASPNNQSFGISYQLVHPAGTEVTAAQLDATKAELMNRIATLGATSSSVNEAPPGGDEITVWVEGVAYTPEIGQMLGQTGTLPFSLAVGAVMGDPNVPIPSGAPGEAMPSGKALPSPAAGS